jgi:hypothetical protein
MEDNEYGHVIGVFTSLDSLAKAVMALPAGERAVDLAEYPADKLDPGRRLDLDDLPALSGAWYSEESELQRLHNAGDPTGAVKAFADKIIDEMRKEGTWE